MSVCTGRCLWDDQYLQLSRLFSAGPLGVVVLFNLFFKMTAKTRDRKYTAGLPLGGLRDGVLTTVTFNLLSLQVCLCYGVWLWFMEKVTGRRG